MKRTFLNYFLSFFVVLTISTLFSSCGNDKDENPDETIIGTWKITEIVQADYHEFHVGDTFTFKNNGSLKVDFYEDGEVWTYYGEYILQNNNIKMFLDDEDEFMNGTVNMTGSNMELRITWDGDNYHLKLKKN